MVKESDLRKSIDLTSKEFVLAGKWRLVKKLGSGSFGDVYLCTDVNTHEEYAVKLEPSKTAQPQLLFESKIYKLLGNAPGMPCMAYYGLDGVDNHYNALVMTCLGKSLDKLHEECKNKFSLKTTCMVAIQLIERIAYIHSRHLLHRDIKPDNFLIGCGEIYSKVIYVCDFGLSKRYIPKKTGKHIPFRDDKPMTGTARYASINAHSGVEQSRRDDLEAIGYVLIFMIKGSLPWQGMEPGRRDGNKDIIHLKKLAVPVSELCKNIPNEFARYINYARRLKFEQAPDYRMMQNLFRGILERENLECDNIFDWAKPKSKEKKKGNKC